jgi:hypothetical protein
MASARNRTAAPTSRKLRRAGNARRWPRCWASPRCCTPGAWGTPRSTPTTARRYGRWPPVGGPSSSAVSTPAVRSPSTRCPAPSGPMPSPYGSSHPQPRRGLPRHLGSLTRLSTRRRGPWPPSLWRPAPFLRFQWKRATHGPTPKRHRGVVDPPRHPGASHLPPYPAQILGGEGSGNASLAPPVPTAVLEISWQASSRGPSV